MFGDPGTTPPENVRAHLVECEQCRALFDSLAGAPSPAPIPPSLYRRISHSLADSLTPVRPLPAFHISLMQIILLFVVLSGTLIAIMGTAGVQHMTTAELLVMSVLLGSGIYLFSLSLAWQMRPGSYQPIRVTGILGAFGSALLGGMVLLFPWRASPMFASEGWPCLISGLAMAVLAAALLWVIVRRGAPLSFRTTGAALGATAGLVGVTALQFQCPHQEAPHLLVWHGTVLAIATGLGVITGQVAARLFTQDRMSRQPVA
jgi:hypothetical protein